MAVCVHIVMRHTTGSGWDSLSKLGMEACALITTLKRRREGQRFKVTPSYTTTKASLSYP